MTSNTHNTNENNENASKKSLYCDSCFKNTHRENLVTSWINNGNDNSNKPIRESISLSEIRELYGFDKREKVIQKDSFYNFYEKIGFDNHFIKRLYIHYLLVIGNYPDIHKFIVDYSNLYSIDSFEIFINSPLYIPIHIKKNKIYYNNETKIDKIYHLYPITTCMMWNNKPELVRLLVSFGAVLDKTDNLDYYPEEAIRHIPYFNPIPYLEKFENYSFIADMNMKDENGYQKIYSRNIDEFKNVVNEVRYITGEDVSHNWFYPI